MVPAGLTTAPLTLPTSAGHTALENLSQTAQVLASIETTMNVGFTMMMMTSMTGIPTATLIYMFESAVTMAYRILCHIAKLPNAFLIFSKAA